MNFNSRFLVWQARKILPCRLSCVALALGVLVASIPSSCLAQDDPNHKPTLPKDELPAEISTSKVPMGFEGIPKAPADNPTTLEKANLGRRLFFDPILSTNGTVSCATCHQPEHGFASPEPISIGIHGRKGTRNAPTVLNSVFGTTFSWDGRDDSLEQQALGPLKSETELGGDLEAVVANILKDRSYVDAFVSVFANGKSSEPTEIVTIENVAKAVACFERTLVTGNSMVDRFRNSEYTALSKSARQGMWIFESRGGCWKCHSGANLTDGEFHNTGVQIAGEQRDLGRMKHTSDEQHKFQFKTPTLRNIENTAPYMHDGSVKTLRKVVEFYNKGGEPKDPLLDEKMEPLNLSEKEIEFLVDFLKAFTGDNPAMKK